MPPPGDTPRPPLATRAGVCICRPCVVPAGSPASRGTSTFAPAQHGNEAHAPDFAEATHVHSWDTIYGKPTEYPASNHGNERHNPDFVTTSEYSVHRHGVTVPAGGTWYDTTAPV